MPARRSTRKNPELPRVIANFAITWDGRISTRNRTPSDFSSPADKARLLQIRSEGDAVLASAATVAADTMTMGLPSQALREARLARGQREYPLRVLLSGSGNVNPGLRLFSENFSPVVVFSTERMPAEVRSRLEAVAAVRLGPGENPEPRWVLSVLKREFGVEKVVFEGGGALFYSFLKAGVVDELCLTLCPRVFGGAAGVTLTGAVAEWLPASVKLRLLELNPVGDECFTRWRVG